MNDKPALLADTEITEPAPRRRRPLLKATAALSVAGWAALALGAATPLKGLAERRASAALGRTVTIGGPLRVIVTPLSIRLSADGVRIANPAWAQGAALLEAGQVSARLATFDLLVGKPGFRALSIDDATLDLQRSADGETNWTGGAAGTLFDLAAVRQIDADRVTLRYRDQTAHTDMRLALSSGGHGVVDLAGSGLIRGGNVKLNGEVQSAEERAATLDLRARTPDFALVVTGEAPAPLRLGEAQLTAGVRGEDFARLAALGGIGLPAMAPYALTARVDRKRKGWHFSHIAGRIGETDLAGTMTLTRRGDRPLVVANLSSRTLGRGDAMALFGLSNGLAPVVDGEASYAAVADRRLLPDARLSPEALRDFDALVDYRAERLLGVDHQPAHVSLRAALLRGRLQLSPASVDLAGGFVSSDIFIDARSSPALVRADIRLSPTPMGRLLAGWGISPAGTTAMVKGRIQLTGRGETLREAIGNADGRIALILPAGDVHTRPASASSLDMANLRAAIFDASATTPSPAGLNCGLVAFTVRNGLATADPILIDTDGAVLSGEGRIDLRDETINLRLRPNAKSLGWFERPANVTIGGTLDNAFVAREPVNWFRPARFFGFSVLLPDIRRVLGFVDPDEAEAPACGPVLRGAPASAQGERNPELASLR